MMKLVTKVIQVSSGIRISFMPGALRFTIVVMKFTPPMIELTPRIERPSTQKSTLLPGENCLDVRLAYPTQLVFGAIPNSQLEFRKMPPNKKIQNERAFSRGKAMSRAPI